MKSLCLCLLALVAIVIDCPAPTIRIPDDCWKAMQNISNLHEIHSETNLPVVPPGWPMLLPQRRFLWGVTDGNYFVVHHEYFNAGNGHTNYSISIVPASLSPVYQTNTFNGYIMVNFLHPFKDYPTYFGSLKGQTIGSGR